MSRPASARRRRRRDLRLAALLALALLPSSCMTSKLIRAQESGSLVKAPDHRIGGEATDVENRFANGVVGFVLFPFALIGDIVLFPVQILAGYPPYGEREFRE